jgi:hypothetical protein
MATALAPGGTGCQGRNLNSGIFTGRNPLVKSLPILAKMLGRKLGDLPCVLRQQSQLMTVRAQLAPCPTPIHGSGVARLLLPAGKS